MARPVDIEVFGRKMRLNGTRNIAERRLLIQPQHFDPVERAYLSAHLRPGDTAIDIGANIGAYALVMAGLVGASGRVIAVEPQPAVLERLKVNVALNPDLKVEIAPLALGGAEGEATFEVSAVNEGESRLSAGSAAGFTVRTTTLRTLLADAHVKALAAMKIDVEGAEPEILLPFFGQAPKSLWPRLIVLERVHNRWEVDLVAYLRSVGYQEAGATKLNVILRCS